MLATFPLDETRQTQTLGSPTRLLDPGYAVLKDTAFDDASALGAVHSPNTAVGEHSPTLTTPTQHMTLVPTPIAQSLPIIAPRECPLHSAHNRQAQTFQRKAIHESPYETRSLPILSQLTLLGSSRAHECLQWRQIWRMLREFTHRLCVFATSSDVCRGTCSGRWSCPVRCSGRYEVRWSAFG
jgi:hypothetical protein